MARFNTLTEHFIVSAVGSYLEKRSATKDELVQHVLSIDSAFDGHNDRLSGFIGDFLGHLETAGQVKVQDGRYEPGANWK